jgi:hypothetical protein
MQTAMPAPADAQPSTSLPVLVPAAAPVASVSSEPVPPAMADSALPSPEILQQVRVLPPSRYSQRERQLQH